MRGYDAFRSPSTRYNRQPQRTSAQWMEHLKENYPTKKQQALGLDALINFGKWKHCIVKDVLEADPEYFNWAVEQGLFAPAPTSTEKLGQGAKA